MLFSSYASQPCCDFSYRMYELFPARVPGVNSTDWIDIHAHLPDVVPGDGRSATTQAGFQMLALVVTIGIASVGGALVGEY